MCALRVLEIGVDLDGGGIDRYLYNNCTRIKDIEFEFVIVEKDEVGILEAQMKELGYKIYKVPRLKAGVFKNYKELKRIIESGKYDIVHCHLGYKGFVAMLCAKRCGVGVRIVHSHIANEQLSFWSNIEKKLFAFCSKKNATEYASCGVAAAKWVWGKKAYASNRVKILHNAIPTNDFKFSSIERKQVRSSLGLEGKYVVGHVGRLCDQKNQLRLIDIFYTILKNKSNAYLILVGIGDLETPIRNKVNDLGISDSVLLLGVRDDVNKILNGFDAFVFPSKYEGFPFTLVETQCNGLHALCADTVSSEVCVTNLVEFCSLEDSDDVWANRVLSMESAHDEHAWEIVKNAGYDLDVEARNLRDWYYECADQHNPKHRI